MMEWVKTSERLPGKDGHICLKDYLGRYRDAWVVTKEKKHGLSERNICTLPTHGIIIKKWKDGYWLNQSLQEADQNILWGEVENYLAEGFVESKDASLIRSHLCLMY